MTAAVLLSSLVMTQGAGLASDERAGRTWRGTSICTKADWNAACHDEEVLYDFQEGVAPGHVLSKGAQDREQSGIHGRPRLVHDETAKAWVAEFSGPRVQSR
jgi:hypothetical protein